MRIFVEGLGRCGSSVVYVALAGAAPVHFRKEFFQLFREVPMQPGIYKTHDYPPERFTEGDRVIYLFGDPDRIVRSVLFTDRAFKEEHFRNFGREFVNNKESLEKRDGLGLLEHFRAWKNATVSAPIMFLHYDVIWENLGALREFTMLDVTLPMWTPPRELPETRLDVDFTALKEEMTEPVFYRQSD